jgi:RimJ/RimL family protein N-acetyltransferase
MISILKIEPSDATYYSYCEELLVASFPEPERRDLTLLRDLSMHTEAFSVHVITNNDQLAGLLNFWNFNNFIYFEHFAIDTAMRNKGIGQLALSFVTKKLNLPIVLEVELPEDEMSQRRIKFYERQGFQLWQHEYMQPPYRKGQDFLPMKLMTFGDLNEKTDFEIVKNILYHNVYFFFDR